MECIMKMDMALKEDILPLSAFSPHLFNEPCPKQELVIDTRFGTLAFQRDRLLHMPIGMLGFGQYQSYGLCDLPDDRFPHFKLLQSIEDPSVSFIILPITALDNGFIDNADILEAMRSYGIEGHQCVLALIITARHEDAGLKLTVNCRAPLVFDIVRRMAWQHVLTDNKYGVRTQL
jgi:flagellar assembly factor FliW